MKKFFTFVFCALCAVSVWGTGTEVTIGTGTATDANVPSNFKKSYSLVEIIYTKTELLAAGAQAGSITGINFKYANTKEHTRTWDVYVGKPSVSSTYTPIDALKAENLVFSGDITTPTSTGWYSQNITFSTPYKWDGNSNIEILIYDHTESTILFERSHYVYTTTHNQVAYTSGDNPYDPTQSGISCSYGNKVPHIKFIFDGDEDPDPSPTINNPSPSSLEYGTIYLDEGDVEKTFKVTASDLTNDITLTTNASAGVTISPSEIAKDNTDLAGDGVAVTVTLSKGYPFPNTNPTITIASEKATSKSVTINATEGQFSTLTWLSTLNSNGYYFLNFEVTIDEINASDKSMEIRATTTKNANYTLIDGQATFAVGGIFNGLKGKYEGEVFKIFSYTSYTAPDPSTSIEIDEEVDNHGTWPEAAQSGKSLIIKRTVVPDCWNTICLPTYLTSTQVEQIFGIGADVRSFIGANITSSSITLNFSEHPKTDGMEAGVPYLIKPTQAMTNPLNLTNQSFTPTPDSVKYNGIVFQGVLVPTEVGEGGDDYIIVGANNTLLHPTGSGTIKGMRAYFKVTDEDAKTAIKNAPMMSMNIGTEDATTILTSVTNNKKASYKTMQNGQFIIVKEGQKVNIFGQTVK